MRDEQFQINWERRDKRSSKHSRVYVQIVRVLYDTTHGSVSNAHTGAFFSARQEETHNTQHTTHNPHNTQHTQQTTHTHSHHTETCEERVRWKWERCMKNRERQTCEEREIDMQRERGRRTCEFFRPDDSDFRLVVLRLCGFVFDYLTSRSRALVHIAGT